MKMFETVLQVCEALNISKNKLMCGSDEICVEIDSWEQGDEIYNALSGGKMQIHRTRMLQVEKNESNCNAFLLYYREGEAKLYGASANEYWKLYKQYVLK